MGSYQRWSQGDFEDWDSDPGAIFYESPLKTISLTVPSPIRFAESPSRLCWRNEAAETKPIDGKCFRDFLNLKGASDDHYLKYAQSWGTLGICEHGIPCTHSFTARSTQACQPLRGDIQPWRQTDWELWDTGDDLLKAIFVVGNVFWEPLSAWRHYVNGFNALLGIGLELREGRTPKVQDWDSALIGSACFVTTLSDDVIANDETWIGPNRLMQRRDMATGISSSTQSLYLFFTLIDMLLEDCGVRPNLGSTFTTEKDKLNFFQSLSAPDRQLDGAGRVHSRGSNLLGVLSAELVAALTSKIGIVRCVECGNPFSFPDSARKPRRDKGYCCSPNCRSARHARQERASLIARQRTPGTE